REGGVGRVTELVARPLINLFFPELSGLIQPLSGEYAGRRSLLESIPFFTGYAVEIGHLIDVAERVGLEGLGQVDLERRVHRNQELEGLTRMSFVILQAVMKRLEERRKARLFAELGSTMKLPRSGRGRLSRAVVELASASGLSRVSPDQRDPFAASTRGTGEVLCAVLDAGVRHIVLGIGGSATTDGGAGILEALGARVGADGVDLSGLDPRLAETDLLIACDVTNPLLGERGAAATYGPQKGASPSQVR